MLAWLLPPSLSDRTSNRFCLWLLSIHQQPSAPAAAATPPDAGLASALRLLHLMPSTQLLPQPNLPWPCPLLVGRPGQAGARHPSR